MSWDDRAPSGLIETKRSKWLNISTLSRASNRVGYSHPPTLYHAGFRGDRMSPFFLGGGPIQPPWASVGLSVEVRSMDAKNGDHIIVESAKVGSGPAERSNSRSPARIYQCALPVQWEDGHQTEFLSPVPMPWWFHPLLGRRSCHRIGPVRGRAHH